MTTWRSQRRSAEEWNLGRRQCHSQYLLRGRWLALVIFRLVPLMNGSFLGERYAINCRGEACLARGEVGQPARVGCRSGRSYIRRFTFEFLIAEMFDIANTQCIK